MDGVGCSSVSVIYDDVGVTAYSGDSLEHFLDWEDICSVKEYSWCCLGGVIG